MKFTPTKLEGCYFVEPVFQKDRRGSFGRIFCYDEFAFIDDTLQWKQVNHSITTKKGTVRGMHYQAPPHSEVKMVKVVRGKILDVVVDLRARSATLMQHVSTELSAENGAMLYIPAGMAHGFQTLTDDVEMIYFHSGMYVPEAQGRMSYCDPLLDIKWPLPVSVVSEADKNALFISNNFKGLEI